jgi:hyperosmotically inducible protein
MRTAILACALSIAACGGADNAPANDPSSATVSSSTTTLTGAPEPSPATNPAPGYQPAVPSSASTMSSPAAVAEPVRPTAAEPPTPIFAAPSMNQGNSEDEIKITTSIRHGIMRDHSLSFAAKNVTIVTVGTKVTLRGPVNSDAEKTAIESRARQTAGVTEVDDQLEVKK